MNRIIETYGEPQPVASKDPWVKAVIYGDIGVGKTTLACELGTRTLLIESEPGSISILNHPELSKRVDVYEYQGLKQVHAIFDLISNGDREFDKYDTVVLDNMSGMQENVIDWTIKNKKFKRDDPDLPSYQDYGVSRNLFRPVIQSMMMAPVNVVIIAHERFPKTEMEFAKGARIGPDFQEAVMKLVTRPAHLVARMAIEKGVRTVQVEGDERVRAKSRIGMMPQKFRALELPGYIKDWQSDIIKRKGQ